MKKCPFCAESIQDEAIKCRFCGEFIDGQSRPQEKSKWFYSKTSLIVSFLTIGPFMLPLLWINPRLSRNAKIFWTIIILVVSYIMAQIAGLLLSKLWKEYQSILGAV